MSRNFLNSSILAVAIMSWSAAVAEPTITSGPTNGAAPSAPVVLTFSEPMNPENTAVSFYNFSPPYNELSTTMAWSGGNTVLTCTPSPTFPANSTIIWSAYGENPNGDPLGGTTGGIFTTSTGGGNGGNGTNEITTFSIGKIYHYNQTSSALPTLDAITPYNFSGVTSLASNRTVTNITLTLPTGAISNLIQLPLQPEIYVCYGIDTSLGTYDATFPPGNYTFLAKGVTSNQTVIVNLPPTNSLPQPGAPHLTNYPAAQAVNSSQTFVLGWDAFPGGTTADYIDVDIGTAYRSPDPGLPGALTGTALTFTIPAGTLQPNSNYFSRIGFFHHVGSTNASYAADAYRATYTEFSLITSSTGQLVLTNASWSLGVFSFDVLCTNGQTVTVEYTNTLASSGSWTKLFTTNSPGPKFRVLSPQASSHPSLFYRARNGP